VKSCRRDCCHVEESSSANSYGSANDDPFPWKECVHEPNGSESGVWAMENGGAEEKASDDVEVT
jgi:hypothetical protein